MNRTLLLFFLSGATSLVYEVVWMRRLSLVFGHSIFSVSTVLTAFMAGLAVGSYLGGRWSDRKRGGEQPPDFFLRTYGRLEFFIGLWGVLSLVLLGWVDSGFLAMSRSGVSEEVLRAFIFVGSFSVLLPPTAAMGATLPVFTQALVLRRQDTGEQLSRIYGLNTLGACLGAAAGGLLMLPTLGLVKTVVVTAFGNCVIAALAFSLRLEQGEPDEEFSAEHASDEQTPRTEPPVRNIWVPFVFGLSGFAGMVYQIGWTRALVLSIGSSTYSFSIILTTFLAALGLGSIVYKRLFSRRPPEIRDLALLQLGIAAGALVVTQLMGRLPLLKLRTLPSLQHSFAAVAGFDTLVVFLLLLLPALALGLTFPLVTHLYTARLTRLGRSLGEAYSANTSGAILGSFLGGFVLLPWLGVQNTIEAAAALNLAGGVILMLSGPTGGKSRRPEMVLITFTLVVGLLAPAWDLGLMSSGAGIGYQGRRIRPAPIFYEDGVTSTVTVGLNSGLHPFVAVNGKTDASLTFQDRRTQLLLGLVPAALHPQPEDVAVVGFGSGQTLVGLLSVDNVKDVRCAELEPAVLEAKKFFSPFSEGLLEDPRLTLVEDDGRSFILGSPGKFDLIVSEPSNPWIAGIGNLYTADFYAGCRAQLKEGGIMGQWFHLYAMSETDIQLVYRTFFSSFPHGALYRTGPGDILLIGSEQPVSFSEERLRELYQDQGSSARWLRSLQLVEPRMLYATYLASRQEVVEYLERHQAGLGQGPVNTDDLPLLEYQAPLSLYSQRGVVTGAYSEFQDLVPEQMEDRVDVLQAAIMGRALLSLPFDVEAALEKLSQAQAEEGSHWAAPAVVAYLSGRVKEAAELYLEAPAEERSWARLAAITLLEQLADPAALLPLYVQALDDSPAGTRYALLMGAGRAYRELGQTKEAARCFEQAVPLTTSHEPLLELATLGPIEEWREDLLRQALERNPYSVPIRLSLARLWEHQGATEKALEQALVGYRLYPLDADLLEILVSLYRKRQDADNVLRYAGQLRVLRQVQEMEKSQSER